MTRVLILRAPGTNCDQETAYAFTRAGGTTEVVHINRLLESPRLADDCQVLCLPGGFSYGDDVAAGRIVAGQIRHHLLDTLHKFHDDGKLILGICNGFQILLKSSLLLPDEPSRPPPATLTWNNAGRFEDRWVHLRPDSDRSPFLQGVESLYLPIAHAEGRFVARDTTTLARLADAGHLALRYVDPKRNGSASLDAPLDFPLNPNGSQANVAGACNATGRIFGMMPHPERFIDPTHHPHWTRLDSPAPPDGLQIFANAVAYFGT